MLLRDLCTYIKLSIEDIKSKKLNNIGCPQNYTVIVSLLRYIIIAQIYPIYVFTAVKFQSSTTVFK